jgi:atypical dual specificity phosphatase
MNLPQNFSFIWDNLVAGSAHPGQASGLVSSLSSLREHGILAILSLTEEPLEFSALREFEMNYLHVPVDDFTAPTPEQIEESMDFMQEQIEQKNGVMVHCHAGIGRTGTILACFMVKQNMDANQAIQFVRRLRPGSLEVYSQEYAVHQYAENVAGSKNKESDD